MQTEFNSYILKRGIALVAVLYLVLVSALKHFVKVGVLGPGTVSIALATGGLLYLLMDAKTLFLPFLGETVLPPSSLRVATPTEATIDVTVDALPGATHAVYWASNTGSKTFESPMEAYEGFKNAGTVKVTGGTVVFPLVCPSAYSVRDGEKPLPKHVHYRFVYPNGILSRVLTQKLTC